MKSAIVIPICAALLAGCAALTGISPEYPNGWPLVSPSPEKTCPDLTGRYQNIAHYSFLTKSDANTLSRRLGFEETDLSVIVLISSPKTIRLEAMDSRGLMRKNVLSELAGDFSCSDGAVVLLPVVEKGADGTGGYRSVRRLYLRRANDASLVGEDRLFGVGAMLWLVPIVGSQTFWYRWSLANED